MTEPTVIGAAHFAVGCLAVLAGFVAFAARKGSLVHRIAGAVFLLSMTLVVVSGLWMSIVRNILFTVFLSLIAFHAFATSWSAAARANSLARFITRRSSSLSASIMVGAVLGGLMAASSPGGVQNDLPPSAFFTVAGMSGFLFGFDILYSIAESPSEQRRLMRHGWRMGFSFFLATGIFFFGNNHVLPEALRTPIFLSAPVLLVVVWTIYYSIKARFFTIGRKV